MSSYRVTMKVSVMRMLMVRLITLRLGFIITLKLMLRLNHAQL